MGVYVVLGLLVLSLAGLLAWWTLSVIPDLLRVLAW